MLYRICNYLGGGDTQRALVHVFFFSFLKWLNVFIYSCGLIPAVRLCSSATPPPAGELKSSVRFKFLLDWSAVIKSDDYYDTAIWKSLTSGKWTESIILTELCRAADQFPLLVLALVTKCALTCKNRNGRSRPRVGNPERTDLHLLKL